MPRTPDRSPGPLVEDEELQLLTPGGSNPSVDGGIVYDPTAGGFKMQDATGVFDPRSGGGGLSEAQHKTLLQLIHFIDDGPAEGFVSGATKTVTGGLFPTKVEWKRQDATLLIEKTIERSAGPATNITPTPVVWKIFDTDGTTVLATVSDAITYSGVAEVSRVRTIS
jgi:hypothetical protein